jgi:hypothetical protein
MIELDYEISLERNKNLNVTKYAKVIKDEEIIQGDKIKSK